MENYIVSARKYRPATFDTVVGQGALTTTLKNAIASGKLAHAYLFCGPRGVGKTTCARIFAKTINCLHPLENGEACNECESCKAFNEQRSYNIHELDAASNNSVDEIRALVDQVRVPPQIGKYKVYIIDEVHMLSTSAFNAFLKTLEEPPHYAIFILATTEKHKILPTILSRCQIYDFNRISVEDTVAHLAHVAAKEGIKAEPEALNVIALKADGGMRDALSIFDQVVSFTGGQVTYQKVIENLNVLDYDYYFRLTDHFLGNRITDSLLLLNEVICKGFDAGHFINGLASHLRNLLVAHDESTLPLLEVGATIRDRYKEQAKRCPLPFIYRALKLCNDCDLNYRTSKNKRLLVEIALIETAQLTDEGDAVSGGRGPKQQIKPFFQNATSGAASAAPAATASQGASSVPASATPVRQTASTAQQPSASTAGALQQGGSSPLQGTSAQGDSRLGATPQDAVSPGTTGQAPANMSELLQQKSGEASRVARTSSKRVSISIRQPVASESSAATVGPVAQSSSVTAVRESEEDYMVNERDINYYWHEYIGQMPQEQVAFKKRMQNIRLTLSAGTVCQIPVENELAAKEFRSIIPPVEQYMRVRLKNSKLTLKVHVTEATEKVRAYSRAERYQMMSQKNGVLNDLLQAFALEFS